MKRDLGEWVFFGFIAVAVLLIFGCMVDYFLLSEQKCFKGEVHAITCRGGFGGRCRIELRSKTRQFWYTNSRPRVIGESVKKCWRE